MSLRLVVLAAVSSIFAAGCFPKSATAAEGGPFSPVVVELFTSEGCSSCPPADAVLSRLEVRGSKTTSALVPVVPLAFHVDYWDELGWKDPYSSAEWTRRQRDYGRAAGKTGLFTPEVIVDGRQSLNGSDAAGLATAIASAAAKPKARVDVIANGTRLEIKVGALPRGTTKSDIALVIVEKTATVTPSRGENAGRTLHHTAIVHSLKRVGVVEAEGGSLEVPAPDRSGRADRVIVLVQERSSRAIVGATVIPG